MISLDEVRKLYDRIQHVYDDAFVPVEAGLVKRLCAEVCDQRMLSTAPEPLCDCFGEGLEPGCRGADEAAKAGHRCQLRATQPPGDVIRSRAFWSDGHKDLLTAYVSADDITLMDDNGHIYEPAGDEMQHGPTPTKGV